MARSARVTAPRRYHKEAHRPHRKMFRSTYGDGPYPCEFCLGELRWPELYVHHRDHDHDNNDPSNLAPSHESCHNTHHKRGVPQIVTPEGQRNRIAAHKGKKQSREWIENAAAPKRGKRLSAQHREAIAAGHRGVVIARVSCVRCRRVIATSQRAKHTCKEWCE